MKHGPMLTKAEADAIGQSDPRCQCGYRKSAHVGEPCNNISANRDWESGYEYSQGFSELYRPAPGGGAS